MLIALCFLLSCGGDDPLDTKPEDDIKPEQPEKPSEPDDPEDPENPEKPEIQTKRIKTMTVFSQDGYFVESNLSYDEKNRISQIKSHINTSPNKGQDVVTDFSYQDGLILLKTEYNGDTNKLELILNEQGLVEKIKYDKEAFGERWDDEYCKYEDGYLVENNEMSGFTYVYKYMKGNLIYYSELEDGIYESIHQITYTDKENKLGVSPLQLRKYDKTIDISLPFEDLADRHCYYGFFCFYEGLFGKPSKNMEESETWGKSLISYVYKYDNEGYPIEITSKYFNRNGEYIPDDEDSFTVNIEYWED